MDKDLIIKTPHEKLVADLEDLSKRMEHMEKAVVELIMLTQPPMTAPNGKMDDDG